MKFLSFILLAALFVALSAIYFLAEPMDNQDLGEAKHDMIERHLKGRGISSSVVLSAMESVAREDFVPPDMRAYAYQDSPLPIGDGQTISQPYIVALMTESIRPEKSDKVLEIGTGSGYQTAVLAKIVDHVYSIEIIEALAKEASTRLNRLGYDNVTVKSGDGYQGWIEHAPFNKIVVTAAASKVPAPLEEQLIEGGLIVMPVGARSSQTLLLGVKRNGIVEYSEISAVRFVPMTGKAEERN